MAISKLLPKARNPEVARNWAIFTALFLIILAFIAALAVAFLLPKLLASILPNQSEHVQTAINVILGLIGSAFFIAVSWDMVNGMVGSAIDAAVEDKIENEIKPYRDELENYRKIYSMEAVVSRQNQEFYAVIPGYSRRRGGDYLEVDGEPLHKAWQRRVGRDAVIRGLAYDEELLSDIAISASKRALGRIGISKEVAMQDINLQLFRQDIFVYLKAWLMLSISNEREMPVNEIKLRYPDEQRPDISSYIDALTDIKERLIKHEEVVSVFDLNYREEAIDLLDEYLGKLISALEEKTNDACED